MIKWSIQRKDVTFVNIYRPNIGVHKYIKQILIDIMGEIDNNEIIVRDINTSITSVYRSSRQKINKEPVALNDTLAQTNIYIHTQAHTHIYIYIKHSIQKQQSTHSFQVYIEHSPE